MAMAADGVPKVGIARFTMVMRAPKILRGQASRDPGGATVSPSGVTELNVSASELFAKLAQAAGVDPEQFAVVFGADEETRQVGCWVVDPKAPGATAVRHNAGKKTLTVYLGGVFADLPDLRPASHQSCAVTETTEADSTFAVISLGVALDKRRAKRKAHAPHGAHQAPAGM